MANAATTSNGFVSIIATSVSEFASSIATKFETIGDMQLPIPNQLHDYASYDYVLGLGVLTDDHIANPDTTYMTGDTTILQMICKSASCDPENRVKTDYGKFDFFIDNLNIDSVIGLERGNVTNATNISFTVTEPYSMGIFTMSCQQAAWDAGHKNWREAPFLLTIEFRGSDEMGNMTLARGSSRYIPVKFQNISMTVDHHGAIYQCEVFAWNDQAHSSRNSTLKSDMSIKGTTVQEVLQSGEKSLQAVWNKRLQQLKENKIIDVPDEIIILFPTEVDSASAPNGGPSADELYTKLGVKKNKDTNTVEQDPEKCNIIGKAVLGVGTNKAADAPFGKDNAVYDEKLKVNVRANNTPIATENDLRFRQDTSIPNAINQVLLQSNFPQGAFDPSALSEEGYLKWWRVDVQVYNVSSDATYASTGRKPKIIVYRVLPYNVHNSAQVAPGDKPKGMDKLAEKNVKEYNYLYTGKNTDVLHFEIKIENSFAVAMAADGGVHSQDVKESAELGSEESKVNQTSLKGNNPPVLGEMRSGVEYTKHLTGTDRLGGGGSDTTATRAARIFHDAVTAGTDMMMLDLEIAGDPFFIAQSGIGNYTSKQTEYPNLNTDGSVNYQNGEVHIVVNFRIPVDINQSTGMYQFGGEVPSSPLLQYSGLFKINQVTSNFNKGMFKQHLLGQRLPGQESLAEESSFSFDSFTNAGEALVGGVKKLYG